MTYTYTDQDHARLSVIRCNAGIHFAVSSLASGSRATSAAACVASADVPKFVNEVIGYAHAGSAESDEDREFNARTALRNHGVSLDVGRTFTLEQAEALAEVVKGWDTEVGK